VQREHFEFRVFVSKAALMMGMAKKRNLAGGIEETFERLGRCEDVFIFVLESAMYQNDSFGFEGALRKSCEPAEIFVGKLGTRPIHGGFGYRIKVIGGHEFGNGFVVISADGYSAEFADDSGDFIGIGTIADDIAEANQALPAPLNGTERGFQSGKICMDIRKD
jgi:hypothetical protein